MIYQLQSSDLSLSPSATLSTICTLGIKGNEILSITGPVFELEGNEVGSSGWSLAGSPSESSIYAGGSEVTVTYSTPDMDGILLEVIYRVFSEDPVVRFRYRLHSKTPVKMTKSRNKDNIIYFGLAQRFRVNSFNEIQFAHFERVVHSYMPSMEERTVDELASGISFAGPIALWTGTLSACESSAYSALVAYEHGCDHPLSFVTLDACAAEDGLKMSARAEKGNYYDSQVLGPECPYETIWFQVGLIQGSCKQLLQGYRSFFLNHMSPNQESRQPYIFYNTWNHQERNKYFKDLPYLHDMTQERMLAEVDVAHKMGIDVFVIDTGWYGKTGDWLVNLKRFPDGLEAVRKKLQSYGMKLGLWFNPVVAAKTSQVALDHPEYISSWNGNKSDWGQIWETEEAWGMCLCSEYSNWYIEKLVQLYEELGVRYFKWDAIGQYGCNSPDHWHGTSENSSEERADNYAFQMANQMVRIVSELTRRCPEAIVDFDITENGRSVGLGFLSVGKYFLVNNGPYFHEFDIPRSVSMKPDTINVFFYPGPARPRVCRQGVKYDSFIPSILFLTHYLPDGPRSSQENSFASMILGGNGIWGDLVALTQEDLSFWCENIAKYKQVAKAVTRAVPKVKGFIGSSPEIHEKIDYDTNSGVVVFFSHRGGKAVYVTAPLHREAIMSVDGADSWEFDEVGRLRLTVDLAADGARVVFVNGKNL